MTQMAKNFFAAALGFAAIAVAPTAGAETLRIGLALEPTSIDPHFHNLSPNHAMADHIYSTLTDRDANMNVIPDLAESWRAIDDKTWEFQLRKDAKWHDGSPVTADDVVFSMQRAMNVPNSPSSLSVYIQDKKFEAVGRHTVRVRTPKPAPLTPAELTGVPIVSRKHGEKAATRDYNDGTAAIGSGPFRFIEWKPGNRLVVERFDGYFGKKPEWSRVEMLAMKSNPSRVAALLAGKVDVIDNVPTSDLNTLGQNNRIKLWRIASSRVMFMFPDHAQAASPEIRDVNGKPMKVNPLADRRVRKALSLAIDRKAIVERVMEGAAVSAGQIMPPGFFGRSDKLSPDPFDPARARQLLAEAGYPNGFQLTIHGPNDRYINDAKVTEAIAQMTAKIGIRVSVKTLPKSVYFARATKRTFSYFFISWGNPTGEPSSPLLALAATHNPKRGRGTVNRGRYSSKEVDGLIEDAIVTIEDAKRERTLQRATEVWIGEDLGVIPTHFQMNIWATRPGLKYDARADERTIAQGVVKDR